MELSYKEFELLTYFLENQGIALSREKILNKRLELRLLRRCPHHRHPRQKNFAAKWATKGDLIKTIWGMGYKFEADES